MPLESPPRKRTCRLATAAACLAARAPLAPFPSSDGLVPRVVAVGIQFKRVWLARLEAVREQERAPDPVLLVHPPPRPLAWSVPEGGVDRRLCPVSRDDPSVRQDGCVTRPCNIHPHARGRSVSVELSR